MTIIIMKEKVLTPAFVGSNEQKEKDARLLVNTIERINKPQDHRESIKVLEVGGGEGLISFYGLKKGFNVLMCDLSAAAVKRAQERGVPAYRGEITDTYFNNYECQFDAIVALEVIEHIYDPMNFFRRVYQLLKPSGVFVYTTGNFQETRFLGRRWGYLNIPEVHLYFYTPKTIKQYFKIAGFSKFLDPYKFYYKYNVAVRLMSKIGVIYNEEQPIPSSILENITYKYMFKLLEGFLGRLRLPFAQK